MSSSEQHLDYMKLMRECPICAEEYEDDVVNVLEDTETASMIHVTCESCHNAVLALVQATPVGMNTIGILTDQTAEDYERTAALSPLSEDDVLDLYSCLTTGHKLEQSLRTLAA